MRWFCLLGVTVLAACGSAEVQSQKLRDGSYKVTCELTMDDCIRRVQDQCKNKRFRIEGTSETRLRDVYPFEQAFHTSRLQLTCTNDGAKPWLSLDKPSAEPSTARSSVCAPGETRVCVGPGACKGGQACIPGGDAFGPCDCGPVASPAPSPPTQAPASPPGDVVTPPATNSVDPPNPAAK